MTDPIKSEADASVAAYVRFQGEARELVDYINATPRLREFLESEDLQLSPEQIEARRPDVPHERTDGDFARMLVAAGRWREAEQIRKAGR